MNQTIKTILVVLGLASAYPEVAFRDVGIYRHEETVSVEFVADELLNDSIRYILDAGYETVIHYEITTYRGIETIYAAHWVRSITNDGGLYDVNLITGLDYDLLQSRVASHDFVILTNASRYRGSPLRTVIKLYIACDSTPDLIELWGNKPKLVLNFRTGD